MKAVIAILLLSAQGAYAAWDIRQCAADVKDRHGIRIEEAMRICAGSQAKQRARRQCVIEKVKTQGVTPETALNMCMNGSQRSDQSIQAPRFAVIR